MGSFVTPFLSSGSCCPWAWSPSGGCDLSEEAHSSRQPLPTLITLTARGPLLFPKESAPTDKAVTLHGPCGLTRSVGWRGGVCPTQRAGQETEDSTRRTCLEPPQARPSRWTAGSDGPSHGEVTGRLGGPCPALTCRPRPIPGESVPIRGVGCVATSVLPDHLVPPAQLEGEGWKAG